MNQDTGPGPNQCGACRFFRENQPGWGTCHRYPPTFAGEGIPNERHRWRHPIVQQHHWCGEFAAP